MKIIDKISFSKLSDPLRSKEQLRGMGPGYDRSIVSLQATDGFAWKTLIGPEATFSATGPQVDTDGNPCAHNYIPNSEGVGGAVGVLPTGWVKNEGGGITIAVVAVGNGYRDIRFSGTGTGTSYPNLVFHTLTDISASAGQQWDGSASIELLSGGAFPAGNNARMELGEFNGTVNIIGSGSFLSQAQNDYNINRVLTSGSTTKVGILVVVSVTIGMVVDFTIRISRPQLSKSAVKLPHVPTYGSAAFGQSITDKGLAAMGAWTNALPVGKENGANWIKVATSGSQDGLYYKLKRNDTTNTAYTNAGTFSVTAGASYNGSIFVKKSDVVGSRFGLRVQTNYPNRTDAVFDINAGTIITSTSAGGHSLPEASIKAEGDGFRCSIKGVSNETLATTMLVIGPTTLDGAGWEGVCPGLPEVSVKNPQVTSGIYLYPYAPPGITVPASSSTTGGNGTNTALDARMLEALRGRTDGVELVVNGGFDSATGWVISSPVQQSIAGGKLIYTSASDFRVSQNIPSLVVGARYKFKFTVSSRIAGSVAAFLGGNYNSDGDTRWVSAVGDYSFEMVCGASTADNAVYPAGFTGTIDNISIQRLLPSVFTAAALVYVGAGSGELLGSGTSRNVLSCNNLSSAQDTPLYFRGDPTLEANSDLAAAYDGTGYAERTGTWNSDEIHLKVVQTNAAGTQFRVGNRRYTAAMVPIDALTWGSWAAYDGSMNPLTHFRLALNGVIPLWFKMVSLASKSLSDVEILKQVRYAK